MNTKEQRALTRVFLKAFHQGLKKAQWGDIEPEWFDPDYVDETSTDDEANEWAIDLHKLVDKALEKTLQHALKQLK
jgi:hypothetical protein